MMKDREARPELDDILQTVVELYAENRRITKELAARASLTGPQLTVVKMLEQMGDLSLSELSDAIRAQNSTVTGIVDRMEREEVVERVRSTDDRRVVRIHLTEKGRRLAKEIPIDPISLFRSAVECLTNEEARAAAKLLQKITTKFQQTVKKELGHILSDPNEKP